MAKSPEAMLESMVENLGEKTGKPLEEWVKIARGSKIGTHGELVKFLKAEFGLSHGYANLVAQTTLKPADAPAAGSDEQVEAQYSGKKAALRPIYDALIAAVRKFGGDIEVSPKKSYVSLRRSKQFALIQPTTATRVDIGVNLKGTKASARLEASGSFNAMVSHRVRVSDKSEVDAELVGWLKQAYAAA